MVGRTGSGARVVPPKDSSSAARFTLAVDDSGVAVETSRKFEPSVVESKITVAVVVVVVEERFTDSAETRSLMRIDV